MSVRQIAYRLKSEGKAELLRDQREVGQGFKESFGAAAQGADQAGAAAERLESKYQRMAQAALSSAEAQRTQDRYDALLGVRNAPIPSARDSAAVFMLDDEQARRAQQLRDALDPAAAAQSRLNNELKEYQTLANAGKITTTELASLQVQAKGRYDETTAAIQRQERGLSRLAVASRLNLARQGADVFVTAAMGMNPAMIAIQQGPHILDALATSGIKARGAMLLLGGALSAVAVTAIGAVAAWSEGESAAGRLESAATGLGRASGITSAELARLADENNEAGQVTVGTAEKMAASYVRLAGTTEAEIGRMIAMTRGFAELTGVDAKNAVEEFTKAIGDPLKTATDLTRSSLGLFTQAELDNIEALQESGDLLAARGALLDGLKSAIDSHVRDAGAIESAWDQIGLSIKGAWEWLGRFLYRDESERLQSVIDRRASIERGQAANGRPLDARTQGIYDSLGREGQAILDARADRARDSAQAGENQRAQLDEDRREAAKKAAQGALRRAQAEAARAEREAEAARREALQRMRRDEDRDSQVAIEVAKSFGDVDQVRRLEDEAQLRRRIRELTDEGTTAEAARTKALEEQAPLLAARERNIYREREALTVAASYEVDEILGNRENLKSREKHLELVRRIDAYVQKDVEYYQAWRIAADDLSEIEEARAEVAERAADAREREWRMTLAQASGNRSEWREASREDWIARRAAEIEAEEKLNSGSRRARDKAAEEYGQLMRAETMGAFRDGLGGFVDDIRRSGIRDALSEQFDNAADRLIDKLIDGLLDIDFSGGSGKGTGSWISTGVNFLFGRNAEGTDYWTGGPTWVGERGPELLDLPRGSRVVENARSLDLMRRAAGGGQQHVVVEVVARKGDAFEPEVVRISGAVVQRGMATAYGQSVDTSMKAAPTAVADARAYKG